MSTMDEYYSPGWGPLHQPHSVKNNYSRVKDALTPRHTTTHNNPDNTAMVTGCDRDCDIKPLVIKPRSHLRFFRPPAVVLRENGCCYPIVKFLATESQERKSV